MKRISSILLPLFLSGLAFAMEARAQGSQLPERLSLEDCIRLAQERSLTLQGERLRLEQLKIQQDSQRNAFLPGVSANLGQGWSFGRSENQAGVYVDRSSSSSSFSIGADLPLFTGGRRLHELKAARLNVQAAMAQLSKAKEDLGLRITQLYVAVLYQKDICQIMRGELDQAKRLTDRAQAMVAEGKWPEVKLFEARAQQADRALRLEEAEGQRASAELELLQAMEADQTKTSVELAPLSLEQELREAERYLLSEAEIYREALLHRPGMQALELSIASAEEAVRSARSAHLPQISLSAGYSNSYYYQLGKAYAALNPSFSSQLRSNGRSYIGLSMSIPIFNRFATTNSIRMARLGVLERKLERERMHKSLYKEIHQARMNALLAKSKIEVARAAAEAASLSSKHLYEQMIVGRSAHFEYDEALLRAINARMELSRAQHDFILKARILAFYASQPNE